MAKNINIVFNDGFPGWNGETPNTPRPGWAIEEYLEKLVHTAAVLALPPVTEENNGDFMTVVDGEWAPADVTLDEKIAEDVGEWLEDHPEATTTVQDGAITNAKLASSFVTPGTAAAYSSSATYAVGDYVFYGGTLYRCTTAITTAEAWTAAHWTAAVLGDDVRELKSAFTRIEHPADNIVAELVYTQGGYYGSNGVFVSGSSWGYTDLIPVEAGKKYYINLPANQYICLYDSNKEFVTGLAGTFVTIPQSGVEFIRISVVQARQKEARLTVGGPYNDYVNSDDIAEITLIKGRTNLALSQNRFDAENAPSGYYDTSGVYQSNSNYCYNKITVTEGDVLKFYYLNRYDSSLDPTTEVVPRILAMRFISGFDASGNFVSGSGAEQVTSYTVPSGVDYIMAATAKGGTGDYGRNYQYVMVLVNPTDYPMTYIPYIGDTYMHNADYFKNSYVPNNKLFGKKGVFFGDSITAGVGVSTGNTYSSPSQRKDIGKPFPEVVQELTRTIAVNVGFGGTRMSYSGSYAGASFPAVVDALISGTYDTLQDYVDGETEGRNKDRAQEHLDALEALDFSTVDYIVISYGTNDWAGSATIDNAENPFDKTTVLGGLRYGLDKLLTEYPLLKVFVLTPIYRYYVSEGVEDSDVSEVNGLTLREFSDKIIEGAKSLHAPCKDMYGDCNINKYNYDLLTPGGVHPNDAGYRQMGEMVSGFLEANY